MASADRLIEAFNEAKTRAAGAERDHFLSEACRNEPALKEQVLSLLQAHEGAGDFLQRTQLISSAALLTEKPGDRIGRYKLLQQIGEGGCGVVYMAEQEEPVRRKVALKVIKLGMDTRQVIARFEAERQALALMDHPNIAKVLDAGATDTGRPYFVMELVRGVKITEYCDQNNLSTLSRLELFIQVCQSIQHAHQKGIIHRDIKPSNILVTLNDGVPLPKVIDFGIAKATHGKLTDQTVFTAFEQFIGTPAYMSPEQAEMSALDIDTRSDIYSLGVLLYELLTGQTPFDTKKLLQVGLDEIRRTIREQEPARPSTCLSTMLGADLTAIAKHRKAEPPKLIHLVRGDLDWIVMKSLEKDRTRRYETANGLAMDIQRHLSNEPVIARPPGTGYRFQKLVRRNKLAFIAASVVTAALIIGLGVATWSFFKEQQARRQAEAERKIARTEAAKATAISDFLQQLLSSANPDALKGSEYTVRQLLDDFSAGLGAQLAGQPEVEATVRATIGNAYRRLGVIDKAAPHLERALALRRRLFGNQSEQVAESLVDSAWACFELDQLAKGESQAREALGIYQQLGTVGRPVISALWVLEKLVSGQGRSSEVDAITQEALTLAGKSPGVEFPEMASMIHALAEVKNNQARYDEAATLASKAVAMHRRLHGAEHPETAWALLSLGVARRGQQKLPEAETALREALTIFRKYYPSGHKSLDYVMNDLSLVLEARGDSIAVEALYREILSGQRAALGNDSPAVAETLSRLAASLYVQGKPAEAEQAAREAIEIILKQRQDLAKFSPGFVQLGEALKSHGKSQDVEKFYEDAIKGARQNLGETNLVLGQLLQGYGDFLEVAGRLDAAEAEYRQTIAFAEKASADSPNQAVLTERLGAVKARLVELVRWRRMLPKANSLYREAADRGNPADLNAYAWFLASCIDSKFRDGAEAIRLAEKAVGATTRTNAQYLDTLSAAYAETGDFGKAISLEQEAIAVSQSDGEKRDFAAVLLGCKHAFPRRERTELTWVPGALLNSGNLAEAEELLREALGTEEKLPGDQRAFVANLVALVEVLRRGGKPAEADAMARATAQKFHTAMAPYEKLASDSNRHQECWAFAVSYEELGEFYRRISQPQAAEKVFRDTQVLWRKLVADFNTEDNRFHLAVNYDVLGNLLRETGRATESLEAYRNAQAIWVKLVADSNLEDRRVHLGWTDDDIGQLLTGAGRLDEAAETYRQALAVWKKLVAEFKKDDYRNRLSGTLVSLATTLQTATKRTEAELLFREAAEHADAPTLNGLAWLLATGPDPKLRDGTNAVLFAEKAIAGTNRANPIIMNTLAAAYAEAGQFTSAVRVQQEAIALLQNEQEKKDYASRLKLYENNSPYRDHNSLAQLTRDRLVEGKFAEAERLARECLALREMEIPDDWRTFNARSMLGGALLGRKNYAEAEPLLLSAYNGMKQREDKIPPIGKPRLQEVLQRLVQLYEATDQSEKAAEWKKKLAEFDKAGFP